MGFNYTTRGSARGSGNTAVTDDGGTPLGAAEVTTGTMFSFSGLKAVDIDSNGDGQSLNNETIIVDGVATSDGGQFYRLDGIITYTDGTTSNAQNLWVIHTVDGQFIWSTYDRNTPTGWQTFGINSTKEIATFEVSNTVSASNNIGNFWSSNELTNVAPEDAVDGTSGDDTMGIGYVDAQGDVIDGADGDNDVIFGYAGNDTIEGGDGDDIFIHTAGEAFDITDFGTGSTDADDGDNSNDDFIVLSSYYTDQAKLEQELADDGILNQSSGDYSDNTSMGGGQVTGLAALSGITGSSLFEQTSVPCFVSGTEIATARGLTTVERLKVGDRVITRDNGLQEIRWIGSKRVSAIGKLAPIRIAPGVLGPNDQYLWLSPNHRVLKNSADMGALFGESEVLVAAKHLVGQPGITRQPGGTVEYFHILFDAHELVLSNDIWTESFFPCSEVLAQDNEMREEILNLFPELDAFEEPSNYGPTVRTVLKQPH